MVRIETFLPAFLISQKSKIFASFPPGEALALPRQCNYASFTTIRGILATRTATTAVRRISGTMYMPL